MEAQLSRKITNISLLLMVLVVFIHGYNENLQFGKDVQYVPPAWLCFLERFFSDGICRIAVPLFFAISGYLACESIGRTLSISSYSKLLKKRVFSLMIPYLLVSAAGILLVIGLQLFPFSRPFFNNYSLEKSGLHDWGRVWLLDPVPYQLWFIRFLMNYFLFFPVLFFVLRYLREFALLVLFAFWAYTPLYHIFGHFKIAFSGITFLFCLAGNLDFAPYIPTQKNELEGLFFFALGIYASLHSVPLSLKKGGGILLMAGVLWLCWVAYRTGISLDMPPRHNEVHYHLIGFTLMGVILFWYLFDLFSGSYQKIFSQAAPYTFGIFLFHEPLLTILKKGIVKMAGPSDISLLISYLFTPVVSFAFALLFSRFIAVKIPGVYSLFTGNRQPDQPSRTKSD